MVLEANDKEILVQRQRKNSHDAISFFLLISEFILELDGIIR